MPVSSPPPRKLAFIAGVFWIVTFVASIPALFLYSPVLNHAQYVLGAGSDTRIAVGAFLEVILAIAGIGTAVTMFPIIKRQNESMALGFIASRVLESTIIVVGIISVLSVVTLRKDIGGNGAADAWSRSISGRFSSGPASAPVSEMGCCWAPSCTAQSSCRAAWPCSVSSAAPCSWFRAPQFCSAPSNKPLGWRAC